MGERLINVYELNDGENIITGITSELEDLGFDMDQVRTAAKNQKCYRGYMVRVVGKVVAPKKPAKKILKAEKNLNEFEAIARSESKTYGQLQQEETLGRRVV